MALCLARRKIGLRTGRVIVVEIKARRARRIGGYGEFCATRRSTARDGPDAAPFFDGLLARRCAKFVHKAAVILEGIIAAAPF